MNCIYIFRIIINSKACGSIVRYTMGTPRSKVCSLTQFRFSPICGTAQMIPSTRWERSAWNMDEVSSVSNLGSSFNNREYPASSATAAIPLNVREGPIYFKPAVTTPNVKLRWLIKLRASALGWNPNFSITFWTRMRVSGATSGLSLITRDTVCVDTPAADATCFIVGRPGLIFTAIDPVIAPVIAHDRSLQNKQHQFKWQMSYKTDNSLNVTSCHRKSGSKFKIFTFLWQTRQITAHSSPSPDFAMPAPDANRGQFISSLVPGRQLSSL